MASVRSALAAAFDSRARFPLRCLAPLLLLEAALCAAIIYKVPYTEIDWRAYMQQVAQYKAGERDYARIKGGTGPLVYPAGHVFIYSFLYDLTGGGRDILTGQWVFMGLYLATLAVVALCYREARAPPYLLPLLTLSKRLHSIYLLRLFNDPLSILLLFTALLAWQKRHWTLGSLLYSLSVSVKMNTLLCLPAVGAMYLLALGRDKALRQALIMAQLQFILATPFRGYARSYLAGAFELTRAFLFRWTVNWRFVGEAVFSSRGFSLGLLGVHLTLLSIFLVTRWKRPSRRTLPGFISLLATPATGLEEQQISLRVTPRYVLTTVLGANAIGMLCARSLHYQFYSWLAWGTPYLLWRSGLGPVWVGGVWAAQEWAWNVYPSTGVSSGVVVGCLGVVVAGVWAGSGGEARAGGEEWEGEKRGKEGREKKERRERKERKRV